ncbi:tetratricopeptide (TPR) repeat protein [Methylohalomonas lacus]|uniref:Tetratricopeptide (TPR) repeat protein n=1 Tax=Methylohalomonas lacus TaxID=398773 RepID=A0AAE3L3Y7_9GAMM|nr:HEAT repeat domain-containing protein [Methylohalomonas lacus]MCS3903008.1 tetratricopeptide (TPR) repeat protein [Methylohalomonas lacus]
MLRYIISVILLLVGVGLECLALVDLLHLIAVANAVAWQPFWLHLLAALLATAAGARLVPQRYRQGSDAGMIYLFSMALFIPLLGVLIITLSLLPGLWTTREPLPKIWEERRIPDLAMRTLNIHTDTMFMRDGLMSSLLNIKDPDYRQEVISSCQYLNRRQAVPILRAAMADPAEEVRLQAFAMISKYEKQLEEQVNDLEKKVEHNRADDRAQEMLARLYWEYNYLDLARSTLTDFFMHKAMSHLEQALALVPNSGRWLMLTRISTSLGEFEKAQQAIVEAGKLGLDQDHLAPYQAELSFRRGNYRDIPSDLDSLSEQARNNPTLAPVVAYWT